MSGCLPRRRPLVREYPMKAVPRHGAQVHDIGIGSVGEKNADGLDESIFGRVEESLPGGPVVAGGGSVEGRVGDQVQSAARQDEGSDIRDFK